MNRLVLLLSVAGLLLAQPPVLRKGVSVEMAVTGAAEQMLAADAADSLIVAVTRSGQTYLETEPVVAAELTERLKGRTKVYVKVDRNSPYGKVADVLQALRSAGAGQVNLLISSRSVAGGSPTGVTVSLAELPNSQEKTITLDPAGPLSFGELVSIIDASRLAGVKVVLK